ncbi:nucleoside/nucleotide kinase family protein [Octadecabacter sp. R77987]|uniref:nucleoside/nucleotide kinase family protein n=1 Tax=Octadecabacter sp. R77987 TaxID=3093874 RepID=UPI00366D8EF4
MINVTAQVNEIAERVHDMRAGKTRLMVAICGAPASGKSTLAAEVARRLTGQKCSAAVVPMDGFHLDNAILQTRGILARKGAPETFDGNGFVHMVNRLRGGGDVAIPVFDRARDIAIAGAEIVPHDCQVILAEGNYLLMETSPWDQLQPLWDLTVMLDVPIADLRARLIQRWLSHGLSSPAAKRRAESNDIPNAQAVIDHSRPADIILNRA